MFVSVIFNTEYMDYASRKMWYLKNLYHCKQNGWVLITHDYIRKHFDELQDSITDRFIEQFEMQRFTWDDVKDVEQYFVPDELFDGIEEKCGSRTEAIFYLNETSDEQLHRCLEGIFKEIEEKHKGERIDGIINCLESIQDLRLMARKYDVPVYNYSFAALRQIHGYRQTLYQVNSKVGFWDTSECSQRYQLYQKEQQKPLPIFSHEELVAIFGKDRTLPLIPLIGHEPEKELGICCECFSIIPQVFAKHRYTDDDLFYEASKYYLKKDIVVRSHSMHIDQIQVDRTTMHNDPASFILSCKRVAAIHSQIMLKALLWGRTSIMCSDATGFSFMCEKDFRSDRTVNLEALNFYLFGYLIPSGLMFSHDYWEWRQTNPSEIEIYKRHMEFILSELNLGSLEQVASLDKDRLRYLLERRTNDKQLIETIIKGDSLQDVAWDASISKVVLHGCENRDAWRLNERHGDTMRTTIVLGKDVHSVDFFPIEDVAYFSKIVQVSLDNTQLELGLVADEYTYMPKTRGNYSLQLPEHEEGSTLEISWKYMLVKDYLK